jgi:hypothetical protein
MKGLALTDLTPAPRSRRAVEGAAGNPSGLSGHRRRLARLALEFATRRPLSASAIPQPSDMPCPSEPVENSTPAIRWLASVGSVSP